MTQAYEHTYRHLIDHDLTTMSYEELEALRSEVKDVAEDLYQIRDLRFSQHRSIEDEHRVLSTIINPLDTRVLAAMIRLNPARGNAASALRR